MTRTPIATSAGEVPAVVGGLGLGDLSRPLWVAVGWLFLVGFVGTLVLVSSPGFSDRVRERVGGALAMAFATGFPIVFGLFTAGATPLFVTSAVDLTALEPVAVGVFFIGSAVTAVVALVGTSFGLVAVGDRLGSRPDERGAIRSLVVGAAVCAPTQLIPILGTIVLIALASVGCGAVVRERLECCQEPVDGDGSPGEPTVTARESVATSASVER